MFKLDLLLRDLKVALRSLAHTKGLAITVILTLALGIGANAAIFSVVRGVLLRPLVNRDEDRLIYIRQSAPGIGVENTTFSVPEIQDLQSRVKTVGEFGDFSTGMDSPVIMDSSTVLRPSRRTPSTGIFSPGRTRRRSPGLTCASGISFSLPSGSSRRAVWGVRSRSARMAALVRPRARNSTTWPSRTSVVMAAAASK